jgi:hypothetical protein
MFQDYMAHTPAANDNESGTPGTYWGGGEDHGDAHRRPGESSRHFADRKDEACEGWGEKLASAPTHAKTIPANVGNGDNGFPSGNTTNGVQQVGVDRGGDSQRFHQEYAHYPPAPTGAKWWGSGTDKAHLREDAQSGRASHAQAASPSSFRGKREEKPPPGAAGVGDSHSGNTGGGVQFNITPPQGAPPYNSAFRGQVAAASTSRGHEFVHGGAPAGFAQNQSSRYDSDGGGQFGSAFAANRQRRNDGAADTGQHLGPGGVAGGGDVNPAASYGIGRAKKNHTASNEGRSKRLNIFIPFRWSRKLSVLFTNVQKSCASHCFGSFGF